MVLQSEEEDGTDSEDDYNEMPSLVGPEVDEF
jgi:hypothetical protein